jgi:hypothetical protein
MSFPKNQSEQLIVVILGKTGIHLSGSQLHDYAEDKKICSEKSLPTLQTFYNAIKSLNTNNIIKKMGESKKHNFNEELWGLTPNGVAIYENISKLYPILDYVPNWDDIITHCINCEQNREKCFEDYKIDLENVLKENYNFNERYEIPSRKINNLFNSPKNIQEFLFWLLMLKESKKRLMKFNNQIESLEINLE